jgi:hypothetical protein
MLEDVNEVITMAKTKGTKGQAVINQTHKTKD